MWVKKTDDYSFDSKCHFCIMTIYDKQSVLLFKWLSFEIVNNQFENTGYTGYEKKTIT